MDIMYDLYVNLFSTIHSEQLVQYMDLCLRHRYTSVNPLQKGILWIPKGDFRHSYSSLFIHVLGAAHKAWESCS